MSIALLVITDGRQDYLARTVASAVEQLSGPVTEWWMYDDTGDADHRAYLAAEYPRFRHINAGPRQGFGGAIAAAWRHLDAHSAADWVLHVEQDFVFNRAVDLGELSTVMADHPYLAQMALRRQAWNAAEQAAGGVVELHPDAYEEHQDAGWTWLEHRLFLTTNPNLYRRSLCALGWPTGEQSEGRFTAQLLERGLPWGVPSAAVRFGYWGARDSGVWVEHIGHDRAGIGY